MTGSALHRWQISALSSMWTWGLSSAAFTAALDQGTKWLMTSVVMDPPRLIPLTPFFNLTLGLNRGMSFGMLGDSFGGSPWTLIVVSLLIVAGVLVWLPRARNIIEAAGLGAIIGGALGNILDRARLGGVVDFLDFHVAGWHWPAFNVADAGITVGVCLVLASALQRDCRGSGTMLRPQPTVLSGRERLSKDTEHPS